MHPSAGRVAETLQELGVQVEIIEFPQGTRTAQDAADAIGTSLGQIVKSLVFVADGRPVLALVSGVNRLDRDKLGRAMGAARVRRADADAVRQATGFAIGGVPPVGHPDPLPLFMDQDLMAYDLVYAAAGTPYAVFGIDPQRLQEVTGATVLDLAEGKE
ncbi:MAG: YbaK/EbsC family protein [Chloroflexia bacterium]|nr:YbaK/EbsC family protein [Chloroflexia bacterium]